MLKKLGILTLIVFGLLGWVFYGIEHSTFKSNVELFPLANYPQDLNLWFRPNQPDWDTPLLDPAEQQKYFAHLKTHLFGTDKHSYSAWSQTYIQTLLTPEPQTQKTIFDGETRIIEGRIQNREKFFGINFRNHPAKFIKHIQDNMNIASLQNLQYQPSHRAILVQNALIRELPTSDPFLKTIKLQEKEPHLTIIAWHLYM